MRKALRAMWYGLLVSGLLAGCATGPETNANYDQTVDFATYKTFGFFDKLGTDEAGYESLISQQLKASTRRELEARGYAYSASDPDLLVNFNTSLTQQTRVSPGYYGGYYGFHDYRYGYYGGWPGYQPYVFNYVEGTLNIDIVDAKRKQLVWEGVAVGRVSDKEQKNRAATLDAAVKEIFVLYPFRAVGDQG